MISTTALKEFRKIWEEEVGIQLREDELTQKAVALLTVFDAIYKPVKKCELKTSLRKLKEVSWLI